ncbi:hypothetical protein NC651_012519 [Populus alba x Populus x berolinensis]|nr:hypothetical protein NC651_012519 [Populus alba x Populus x berolinensis]
MDVVPLLIWQSSIGSFSKVGP